MVLTEGDFVRINYTGKIKDTGKVFDTTDEKIAKSSGIYDDSMNFKAVPIVIGANHVLQGLDEALIGAEVGEKKKVEVPPEKGYGERDPNLVKVMPIKEFRAQGLKPAPGMVVTVDDRVGRVQSVGAGRVRVDFNHGLAGKVLKYEITIEEKVNKLEEKIRLLLERHFPFADQNDHEIKVEGRKAIVTLPDIAKIKKESMIAKHLATKDIFENLDAINEVEFVEVFKRPEKKGSEKGEKSDR